MIKDTTEPKPKTGPLVDIADLIRDYPDHRPPVIDCLLREGEVGNIIASPKTGKTWLAMGAALSVAAGNPWLGFDCVKGSVLYLDAELHPEELAIRFRRVAYAMNIEPEALRGQLTVRSFRGFNTDIDRLTKLLATIDKGRFKLVVLDALYRFLPDKTSENDNASMMKVYNKLDFLASLLGASILVVHHTSKGSQSDKALTDIGAGAGSISRAADTHIAIREHQEPGLHVLAAVTRSWKPPEPVAIRFDYPLWHRTDDTPTLATNKTPNQKRQEQNDTQTTDKILTALADGKRLSVRQIRTVTGFGQSRVERGLGLLAGKLESKTLKRKSTGKRTEVYSIKAISDGTGDGTRDGSNHWTNH